MGSGVVTVRLEVYLPFRGRGLWRGEEPVPTGATLGQLVDTLALAEPELAVLLNGRWAAPETALQTGDVVAVLRQAEGG